MRTGGAGVQTATDAVSITGGAGEWWPAGDRQRLAEF